MLCEKVEECLGAGEEDEENGGVLGGGGALSHSWHARWIEGRKRALPTNGQNPGDARRPEARWAHRDTGEPASGSFSC